MHYMELKENVARPKPVFEFTAAEIEKIEEMPLPSQETRFKDIPDLRRAVRAAYTVINDKRDKSRLDLPDETVKKIWERFVVFTRGGTDELPKELCLAIMTEGVLPETARLLYPQNYSTLEGFTHNKKLTVFMQRTAMIGDPDGRLYLAGHPADIKPSA